MSIYEFQEKLKELEKKEHEYMCSWGNRMVEDRLPSNIESKKDIERKDGADYTKGKQTPDNSRKPVNALRVGVQGRRQEVLEKEESETSEVSRNKKLAARRQKYDWEGQVGNKRKMYQNPAIIKMKVGDLGWTGEKKRRVKLGNEVRYNFKDRASETEAKRGKEENKREITK